MIQLTAENTRRAIEKCKQLKPRVRFIQDRLFVVYSANNSNAYQVSFEVPNGEKLKQTRKQRGLRKYQKRTHHVRLRGGHEMAIF